MNVFIRTLLLPAPLLAQIVIAVALFLPSTALYADFNQAIRPLVGLSDNDGVTTDNTKKKRGKQGAEEKALEDALRAAQTLMPAQKLVVQNYLRLRQGAWLMSNQHYAAAREIFKSIHTASPSGVTAGLLIAETYRLEGQPDVAKDWFLRAARHYPYRTKTLSGLMRAAQDQRPENNAVSIALYNEVAAQAEAALAQLRALNASGQLDPLAIIFPSYLDEEVRNALLQRCLQFPDRDLLRETAKLRQAVDAVLSLRVKSNALNKTLSELTDKLTRYQQQRDQLQYSLDEAAQRIKALKEQLIANDLSEAQQHTRQQLSQKNNEQTRVKGQINFIDQVMEKLPAMITAVDQQVKALNAEALTRLKKSNNAVTTVLNESYQMYRRELEALSADAAVQSAEIRMSVAPAL